MMATPRSSTRLARVTSILGTVLLLGCGHYDVDRTSDWTDFPGHSYPIMALTPPQFFMQHRPHQVYQYTYDLLEVLAVEGNLAVIAPWETDPTGTLSDMAVPNDVLFALRREDSIGLGDLALLDFRIDESTTTRTVAAPSVMGGGIEHHYQSEVTITLTVRAFPREEQLGRVLVRFEDDLLSREQTVANPRPLLRQGVREAARALVQLLRDSDLEPMPGCPPDVQWSFNPKAMFTYEGTMGEPLINDFEDMDNLGRLAWKMSYYQYFDSDISTQTAAFFEQAEPGLLVEGIGEAYVGQGLRLGDYIVAAGGVPVSGPQSFTRPFILASEGVPITLSVQRNEQTLHLDLPAPGPSRD